MLPVLIKQFCEKIVSFLVPFLQEPCHYINGPEALPAPLTPQQEAEVMENIRRGIPGAREPLITHNQMCIRDSFFLRQHLLVPRR